MPDDPDLVEMEPVRKMWMFENWVADQLDKAELAKNHAYLLAYFWNPEAVKQIMGGGDVHLSTDEEFEESTRMVKDMDIPIELLNDQLPKNTKRKRRTLT